MAYSDVIWCNPLQTLNTLETLVKCVDFVQFRGPCGGEFVGDGMGLLVLHPNPVLPTFLPCLSVVDMISGRMHAVPKRDTMDTDLPSPTKSERLPDSSQLYRHAPMLESQVAYKNGPTKHRAEARHGLCLIWGGFRFDGDSGCTFQAAQARLTSVACDGHEMVTVWQKCRGNKSWRGYKTYNLLITCSFIGN